MQYGRLALVAAAATAVHAASGDLILTDSTYAGITVGENFEITWAGADGPVTIVLVDDADPLNVIPVETIASGQTGTAFNWVPEPTLINLADYAIKIMDSVTSNYGAQFQLIGGATAPATTVATTASATDATTSASTTAESTTATTTSPATTTAAPTTTSTIASTTQFSNTTMTTKTQSKTPSGTGSSTTTASASQTSAPSAANTLASPLALIFLTVAALFSLN